MYKDTDFFSKYKGKMQLFAKYYAISIYVMQIVTPSENTLRNKANFCAKKTQRLKTFGFSWQYYINDNLEAMAKQLYDFLQVIFKVIVDILQKGIHIRIAVIKYGWDNAL